MFLRKKTIAICVFSLLCFILAITVSLPTIIKIAVKYEYPFVNFDDVSLSFDSITLNHVSIKKDNISITSPKVEIKKDKTVLFYGGDVQLAINNKTTTSTNLNTKVNIGGYFDNVCVNFNGHEIELHDVGIIDQHNDIRFDSMITTINYNSYDVKVAGYFGVLNKDNKTIYLHELQTIYQSKFVSAFNVSINTQTKSFTSEKIVVDNYGILQNIAGYISNNNIIAAIDKATINHKLIYSIPIKLKRIYVSLDVENKTAECFVGNVGVYLNIEEKSIESHASCQDWIDAMPVEMTAGTPVYDSPQMNGDVNITASFGKTPNFYFGYTCKLTSQCSDSAAISRAKKPFIYFVYNKDNEQIVERESGPGSAKWVPKSSISENLINAVISMEDPNFPMHHGIIPVALKNSFMEDVKNSRFVRGGSTITMQTVKNLWLTRDKTIGRKVVEIFSATMLDNCFSKDQIIELYLNIIEFSNGIYGIADGSQYYFNKPPISLDPVESHFIASILPKPRSAHKPTEAELMQIESKITHITTDLTSDNPMLKDQNTELQ